MEEFSQFSRKHRPALEGAIRRHIDVLCDEVLADSMPMGGFAWQNILRKELVDYACGGKMLRGLLALYLLHCLSVSEKDEVMADICQQHTDEMVVMEGNVINVCGQQCTVEFQPSADQSWQSWENNELDQAATYPSPYANVHHGELQK